MPAASQPHSPTPEEIMAYLDGEALADSRAAIAAHLAGCKECEMVAASFRDLSTETAAWAVEPPPATLRIPEPALAPPANARVATWRRWRRSIVVVGGLAAAAAIVMVASLDLGAGRRRRMMMPIDALPPAPMASLQPESAERPGSIGGIVPDSPDQSYAKRLVAPTTVARPAAVIRTAALRIVVKDLDGVRAAVERVVADAGGFIDQMTVTGSTTTARELRGTIRVPGDRLSDALAKLRQHGQVVEDSQGAEDVSDQIVDLDARLVNAHATERRLAEILRTRTGKLSDVLDVERELARVRLDIERLDAEKTNIGRRVSYATIGLTVTEERKAGLDPGPLALATRIRVAAADGLEAAFESLAVAVLVVLRAGPTLVIWSLVLALVWVAARRVRKTPVRKTAT